MVEENKLKELQDQINEFQKSLDELKSKPTTRRGRCKELQEGDVFCYMPSNGSAFSFMFYDLNAKILVENCLRSGNAFWTKEDAELWHKIDKRAHELEVQDRDKSDNGWYFTYARYEQGYSLMYGCAFMHKGTRYFTKESANKLVDEFGDDLNFWITGEIG